METIGLCIYAMGAGVMLSGGLWFMFSTFQEGIAWGLLTILFPPTALAFICIHFERAWRPTVVQIVGIALWFAGVALYVKSQMPGNTADIIENMPLMEFMA